MPRDGLLRYARNDAERPSLLYQRIHMLHRIDKIFLEFLHHAAAGNTKARDLVTYFVGQGVGLIDSVKSAGAVVQEFKEDFADAVEHMNALMEE